MLIAKPFFQYGARNGSTTSSVLTLTLQSGYSVESYIAVLHALVHEVFFLVSVLPCGFVRVHDNHGPQLQLPRTQVNRKTDMLSQGIHPPNDYLLQGE